MRIVLKRQPHDIGGQGRINFLPYNIDKYPMSIQSSGKVAPGRAVAVHVRCFDYYPWSVLVRRSRNLCVNVTVASNQPDELHKRVAYMVQI